MTDKRIVGAFVVVLVVHLAIGGIIYTSYRAANRAALPPQETTPTEQDNTPQTSNNVTTEPTESPAPIEQADTVYRVKRGDTYWEIARRHGISVRQLMRYNGHGEDYVLKVGDRLRIPPQEIP